MIRWVGIADPWRVARAWPLVALAVMQVAAWLGGPRAGRLGVAAAWPDLQHPLGIDGIGRDFLWVVVLGVERFCLPATAAAVGLVVGVVGFAALARDGSARGMGLVRGVAGWVGTLPRLLVVMLVMMALPDPSAWWMAAVLLALYLPQALDEAAVRLESLGRERILLASVAHGLPARTIVLRHLALGHLRPTLLAYSTYLFAQVVLAEVAVAYVFGGSAILPGLGTSWGAELRRLMGRIPHPESDPCPVGLATPYAAHVEALQALALVLIVAALIGGVIALGRPSRRGGEDRA